MVTIFSCPKPFAGRLAIIQRNAIGSWLQLKPKPRIILFGDEAGSRRAALELGVQHIPSISCNQFGTPVVSDLFTQAEKATDDRFLCCINCDVILPGTFTKAVELVGTVFQELLMVGRCVDLDVSESIEFTNPDWEIALQKAARHSGKNRGPLYIDYLCFTRQLYDGMPPLAVGRARWDNWAVWRAASRGAVLIDASEYVAAIHQRHDYAHLPGGRKAAYRGIEAAQNASVAGRWRNIYLYSILNCSHRLTKGALCKRTVRLPFVSQLLLRSALWLRETFGSG